MLSKIFSRVFTVGLVAASVYFFYQHNYLVGVSFLIMAVLRVFGYNLERFAKGLGDLAKHAEIEKKCNCVIELTMNVEEVLKHESVRALFDKLRTKGVIKEGQEKDNWTKLLVQNYQQKYQTDQPFEKVKFNIKNNLLWKNGAIDFNDNIYHEFFLPYAYVTGQDDDHVPFWAPKIQVGLSIRIFMVNGIIKLQIGDFSKEYSSDVVEKGMAVYKTYETVTSFPLLYFSHRHRIPENYLNLSMYATNAYYEHQKRQKTDMTRDWKQVVKDVADHNYVCSVADEYVADKRRWDKIIKTFDQKREEWLKREEFNDPYARKDDDDDYLRDDSIYYTNKYLTVYVANYNDLKERREKYVYGDYYEERP
jgi:hypothetical protein